MDLLWPKFCLFWMSYEVTFFKLKRSARKVFLHREKHERKFFSQDKYTVREEWLKEHYDAEWHKGCFCHGRYDGKQLIPMHVIRHHKHCLSITDIRYPAQIFNVQCRHCSHFFEVRKLLHFRCAGAPSRSEKISLIWQ